MTELKTDDVKLASYLSLIGYGDPTYELEGRNIKYIFSSVAQHDVLNFYQKCGVLIAPLSLFEKYNALLAQGKIVALNMCTDVFNQVP